MTSFSVVGLRRVSGVALTKKRSKSPPQTQAGDWLITPRKRSAKPTA